MSQMTESGQERRAATEKSPFATIEEAIEEIRRGRMVVVCDGEDRENEGDLVMAAQFATPEAVNFMAKEARGLICLALTPERCRKLGLNLMAAKNEAPLQTAFTVTIEAPGGVSTGISAHDRARTRFGSTRGRARESTRACSATGCAYAPFALVQTRPGRSSSARMPAKASTPANGSCTQPMPGCASSTGGKSAASLYDSQTTPRVRSESCSTVPPASSTAATNAGSGCGSTAIGPGSGRWSAGSCWASTARTARCWAVWFSGMNGLRCGSVVCGSVVYGAGVCGQRADCGRRAVRRWGGPRASARPFT